MSSELIRSSSGQKGIRFDPRTKLLLLVTLSSLLLSTGNGGLMMFLKPILASMPFILLLLSKKYITGVFYIVLFIIGFLLELYLGAFGNSAFAFAAMTLAAIITRFTPCVIAAFFLMTTTSVSEFMGSMKKMHISDKITIPLSVIFRFFPTVKEDARSINTAMKMRGITPKKPMLMLEYRVVPLMISTVKAGEDLSCSALTRGFGSPKKRTNMCDIGFHFLDYVFCCLCFCSIIVFCFRNQIYSFISRL